MPWYNKNYSPILINIILLCHVIYAGNVAFWSQTSPEYVPPSSDIHDRVTMWPPEIAKNLTYYVNIKSPNNMVDRLKETLQHAMAVWESAADIQFVEAQLQIQAYIIINIEYYSEDGHYHGGGNGWPPARRADGSLKISYVNLYFRGEPDLADSCYEDSWVWMTVHELGHALGLWHEFQRSDRDQYLRVLPDQEYLPVIENEKGFNADTDFDYASVMMYAWTDNDRQPYFYLAAPGTVSLPLPTVNFYQRNGLSPGDIETIQWLYGKPQNQQQPIIHQDLPRDNALLIEWQQQGWKIVSAPGLEIYADDEGIVMEAECGLWDHWTWGGNPPRLEKTLFQSNFDMSVDLKTDYVPFGTHAGIFIILTEQDWIYFGPYENPRHIYVQRTGRSLSPRFQTDSNHFQLRVAFQNGHLRFICIQEGEEYEIETFSGLQTPVKVGIGIKTWGTGEFGYRLIHFQNLSLLTW